MNRQAEPDPFCGQPITRARHIAYPVGIMEKVPFGNTGLQVTRLGFGAAPIGYLNTELEKVHRLVDEVLDAGINVIDTAACYPGSEQVLGNTVSDRRDEFVLISKCGHVAGELQGEPFTPSLITDSIDQSLRRLQTDHIDVMLLHSCGRDVLEQGDALAALQKARDAGKVRHIGYSGDNDAAAYAANLDAVEVIELSVNMVDQHNIDAVLPTCEKRNLGVIAKRPLANAAWKPLDSQPGIYKNYASTYTQRFGQMEITPHDLGFRGYPDVEWPEIALRFTLTAPGVHTAIAGTTSQVNTHANIAAAEKRPLPEDVYGQLRDAFKQAQNASGETWYGQT